VVVSVVVVLVTVLVTVLVHSGQPLHFFHLHFAAEHHGLHIPATPCHSQSAPSLSNALHIGTVTALGQRESLPVHSLGAGVGIPTTPCHPQSTPSLTNALHIATVTALGHRESLPVHSVGAGVGASVAPMACTTPRPSSKTKVSTVGPLLPRKQLCDLVILSVIALTICESTCAFSSVCGGDAMAIDYPE